MKYVVKNTNPRLGPTFEIECADEQVAWQLADETSERLWERNRSFASMWDVNELLRAINTAVEIEPIFGA